MRILTKIACRTVGAIGMGLAIYDTARLSKHTAKARSRMSQADYLEKAYFNSRTLDDESYISNGIRKKTFDLRIKNPLASIWGSIKGGVEGALYAMGNNLMLISSSALAILSKGRLAIVGTIGIGLRFLYDILHNGYGIGKNHPMK